MVGLDVNDGMLAVARAASDRLPIEWALADAAALPLPDAAFDAVVCQLGLQFVADRPAAVREMHRVSVTGARVAIGLFGSIRRAPGYVALAAGLDRHLGTEAGDVIRSIFLESGTAAQRALLEAAGFRDVHVRIEPSSGRYPSAAEFLRQEAASSPLARPVASLAARDRDALVAEVEDALADCIDDDGVVLPLEIWIVTARR